MSEPTLLELLDEVSTYAQDRHAFALRAHAARLRGIFSDPRMVLAFEAPDIMLDVWRRINGGASPPITPGSPGGGTLPPNRPAPACRPWCGTDSWDVDKEAVYFGGDEYGVVFCSEACRFAGRPLHPSTAGS